MHTHIQTHAHISGRITHTFTDKLCGTAEMDEQVLSSSDES